MCGSRAAPPTGTEPLLQPSASARPDDASAPLSPADLERGRERSREKGRERNKERGGRRKRERERQWERKRGKRETQWVRKK